MIVPVSILLGVAVALVSAFLSRKLRLRSAHRPATRLDHTCVCRICASPCDGCRGRPHAELAYLVLWAYIAYAVADKLGQSGTLSRFRTRAPPLPMRAPPCFIWQQERLPRMAGILSLFFAGIVMRHYTFYNLSHQA